MNFAVRLLECAAVRFKARELQANLFKKENKMNHKKSEKGQAIILIVFAMIGLIGLTALTVDGGMAYDDRRHAQNAADSAALAAALAAAKHQNLDAAAKGIAAVNGYDNNEITNVVSVDYHGPPSGACPDNDAENLEIIVEITSHVDTFFAPVVGIQTVTNKVSATTLVCGSHLDALFDGNAIVSLNDSLVDCGVDLGPSGPKVKIWKVTGGGVLSNGCFDQGGGVVEIPDDKCITAVGSATVTTEGTHNCVNQYQTAKKIEYPDDILLMMPPNPCTGAIDADNRYAEGGKIPSPGQTTYINDIFCISDMTTLDTRIYLTNSTLYVTDLEFDIKFSGGGTEGVGWSGTGTGTNISYTVSSDQEPYKGYFMVIAMNPNPDLIKADAIACKQNIEYRGNGNASLTGTIFAPSTCFDASANSANDANSSQFVFWQVTGNGGASVTVDYKQGENGQLAKEPTVQYYK
jgi:hypothetical protein